MEYISGIKSALQEEMGVTGENFLGVKVQEIWLSLLGTEVMDRKLKQ